MRKKKELNILKKRGEENTGTKAACAVTTY